MASAAITDWKGDYGFLLSNLIKRDFKIRYRGMSLGILWSVVNPLVMMGVLTFVFTQILPEYSTKKFPVFLMCGLVPFNFFTLSLISATSSLVDSAALIKRVPFPREVVPIGTVLANSVHFLIQSGLLLGMALVFGIRPGWHWLWLAPVFLLEIVFACGMGLLFSALNVFVGDVRYVVESANTLLFWLVPIVYSFDLIPSRFEMFYLYNPLAAVVMAARNILLDGTPPSISLLVRLVLCSVFVLLLGHRFFGWVQHKFFDYL